MPHVKETYYFSHDFDARNDLDMLAMRDDYGLEGYGLFWIIVEVLRGQCGYKIKLCRCNAIAKQAECDAEYAEKFINDCINKYELFSSDGVYFWSDSLLRRMEQKQEKSEKARLAANARWKQEKKDADAMQTQCDSNASKVKESKVKESKVKESKKFIPPTIEEINKYCQKRNNGIDAEKFYNFYQSKGWMVGSNKMKDWQAAVRTWEQKDKKDKPPNEPRNYTGCSDAELYGGME